MNSTIAVPWLSNNQHGLKFNKQTDSSRSFLPRSKYIRSAEVYMVSVFGAGGRVVSLETAEFGADGELRSEFVDGVCGDDEVPGAPIAA